MRHAHIALAATIAGLMVSATPSNAGPSTSLTSPAADDGLVQKVQIFPRRHYRQYPYSAPPAVVVPHIVPVVPPAVAGEPVIVVPPPRPTSCGEYRYWNGQNYVDARYNRPYLGPRP